MELRVRHRARIEPAVNDFRHPLHLSAAFAGDEAAVHVGPVQFDRFVRRIAGQFGEFLPGAHRDSLSAVRTFPDVERRAPVTVSRKRPVLNVLEPVPEPAAADRLRHPVDELVVLDESVANLRHLDVPGLSRIVQERRLAAPAMRIFVLHLRRREQQAALFQIFQHGGVRALFSALHLRFRRLAAHPGERRFRLHAAVLVHHLHEGRVVFPSDPCVVFAERRRRMNDARAVFHRDVAVALHEKRFFMLFFGRFGSAGVQRLIFAVFELFSGHFRKNFVGRGVVFLQRAENGIEQCLRHVIHVSVRRLHLRVRLFRIHAETDVRRQGPGRRRPCEEVGVLALDLEADDRRALFQRLIALRDFVRGQRRAAARAVRDDLEALVQKTLVPDRFERPPLRLDVVVVIGHVRILHVRPEADLSREFLPHGLVGPDGFLALLDERLDAKRFDPVFSFNADLFLDFQFHGQTVRVPAGLSRDLLAFHRMVTRNDVLDRARFDMADVRLSVRRRRSVVKHVRGAALADRLALSENVVRRPEGLHFGLSLDKILICRYFLIHAVLFLCIYRAMPLKQTGARFLTRPGSFYSLVVSSSSAGSVNSSWCSAKSSPVTVMLPRIEDLYLMFDTFSV